MGIVVLLEEEFGYRHWLWEPGLSAEELKAWWRAIPTVATYFYDGPIEFPGNVHQVYYEPEWRQSSENMDTQLEKGEFIFVKEEGMRHLVPLAETMKLPDDCWHAHLHVDCDSFLKPPDDECVRHAGYITEDEYYSESYEATPEAEEASVKATMNHLKKILKEEADGDNTDDRIVEELN